MMAVRTHHQFYDASNSYNAFPCLSSTLLDPLAGMSLFVFRCRSEIMLTMLYMRFHVTMTHAPADNNFFSEEVIYFGFFLRLTMCLEYLTVVAGAHTHLGIWYFPLMRAYDIMQ